MPDKNKNLDMIIYKLNCLKVDINDIDYKLNNNNKLLIPKQTPKVIKAKLYLKKYNKHNNSFNKFNFGDE